MIAPPVGQAPASAVVLESERDLARAVRPWRSCRSRPARAAQVAAGARALLDEVVAARRIVPLSAVVCQRRPGRGCVLHGPAGEADRRAGPVVELDEVVLVRGAGVAAAAVDLADDDVARDRPWTAP